MIGTTLIAYLKPTIHIYPITQEAPIKCSKC